MRPCCRRCWGVHVLGPRSTCCVARPAAKRAGKPFHGYPLGLQVIVGYNLPEKYWIIRNSWGPGWGDRGYGRLEMTSGGNGPCALYQ